MLFTENYFKNSYAVDDHESRTSLHFASNTKDHLFSTDI